MPNQSQSKQKNTPRDAHHPSHAQRSHTDAARSNADKENDGRQAGQQSAEEELKQLRDRTTHLKQLCRSNGLLVSAAVNSVPDRSIHHPSNITKDTGVAEIRDHMAMSINEPGSIVESVRNNLTFDFDVDYASQEKLKVTNCLQVIEYEAALFKRFKGSWGAEYILREVWSNHNEWLDKTKQDLPVDNSNTRNDEDDDPRSSDGVGSHRGQGAAG
ncbi:hypothetical protein GGX14DRAFT_407763 [Mycena pura]|uniref:Uncharacterized protein n=1 Tax=Mycena pura TaxID=153505 RepID=A0AAD6XWS5_9AGAR|nr:hypothetical protein GGX14DRAFT_407763 [Mycena pura]